MIPEGKTVGAKESKAEAPPPHCPTSSFGFNCGWPQQSGSVCVSEQVVFSDDIFSFTFLSASSFAVQMLRILSEKRVTVSFGDCFAQRGALINDKDPNV